MSIDYLMPKLAMAMNEGTIISWLVGQGERVEQGQPFVTIETEKVEYDCEAPAAGFVDQLCPEGETAACGEVIGRLHQSADEVGGPATPAPRTPAPQDAGPTPAASGPSTGGRITASPLAVKMASDRGLDLTSIVGTGPGGRIVKRDVLEAADPPPQPVTEPVTEPVGGGPVGGGPVERSRIPVDGLRRVVAGRMKQSLQTTAQVTATWESDITDLLTLRDRLADRQAQLGTRISVNALIARAMVYGIGQVPITNACVVGTDVVVYTSVNLGIAVSLPGPNEIDSMLKVGVVPHVERMGLAELDLAMKAVTGRVRDGSATPDDLSRSTITLSSTAGLAPPGTHSTPVLNSPNVSLIGPSTPIERAVVRDGEVVVRTMLPLSLTFDHCVYDGVPAARFMAAIHDCLENPELLLV
ncbi:MAG: 2-oxo acid dehydrogenase subunit E2 [Actinomycetia bacterium]|nr:2-oxo acid dehydrogenase subunit E2 [Actinomycetes bacterium]